MAGGGRKASGAVVLVALLVLAAGAAGLSMCGVDQSAVDACRSYCTVGSTEGAPSRACCDAVAGADFRCLCRRKAMLRSYGNIDADRATLIPSKCGVAGASTSCK
ncbi:putative lipid-transfer protein DIR1 [Oryza brachyantha]|uniref:Bifunctional inhibitor/plant lipid transfer protein/seed storage helical domain-containing protein n=1 Tax=Oryza brachyantha TaxID=4533 RepID=J3L725_ORYBR|nr:putative lipid-transfer protein DIR1 [Oryza brachyantha]